MGVQPMPQTGYSILPTGGDYTAVAHTSYRRPLPRTLPRIHPPVVDTSECMASASPDPSNQNPPLIQRLLEAWQPKLPVFKKRRLAGAPPSEPEIPSDSGILPIPEHIIIQSNDEFSTVLLPETDAATWLTAHVRSTEDVMLSRIPAWGIEGVTTCIFPKAVGLSWPSIVYKPIGKAETSNLRVENIRGKGKGCVAVRAVPRGEPVARERALLVMPRTCLYPRQLVNVATDTMTPNQRTTFFALHNCNSADPNDALGIISTNSFLPLFSAVGVRVLINEALPAVAQMRCSDGIVEHSLEKSEHCAPSPQAKRSRSPISKVLWSLRRLRTNVKSSSLSAITSNARVRSVGGPRKCAIAVTKRGRSSPHPRLTLASTIGKSWRTG